MTSVAERHCRATNRLGERCRATVVNAAGYCVAHDPERPADMRELGRASARARAERRQPSAHPSLREYLREQVDPARVWQALETAMQGNNESARVAAVKVLAQELYEPEQQDDEVARWRLADWPRREQEWSENLMTLGDFNVDRRGDPLYDALTSTGLKPPGALNDVPRTIFDEPSEPHFYDQVAWFEENGTRSVLTLDFLSAGSFDFVPLLQGGLSKTSLSWKISDHYPLWVELGARGRVIGERI